jgi:hypothetical protein
MQDLYVFVPKKSPRSSYTFKLIFGHLLANKVKVHLTSRWNTFSQAKGFKISYGQPGIPAALLIPNSGFLFENELRTFIPEAKGQGEYCVLFPSETAEDLDFDLPSAIFYMVSRYEEYMHSSPDIHGRFQSSESIAYKHGFLDWPIVHIWAEKLLNALKEKYPSFPTPKKKFEFISTIDIDNGFKYRGKPFWRNAVGLTLDCLKLKTESAKFRFKMLFLGQADPYDNYRWVKRQVKRNKAQVRIFLLHSQKGKFDHAVEPNHSAYADLLQKLKRIGKVALHPSYHCLENPGKLISEKQSLELRLKRNRMLHVRRHFLRLQWPDSFQQAYEIGFRHEHSVGYSDKVGFRAGISIPFPFFDLIKNRSLPLTIHPFAVMETVFRYYTHEKTDMAYAKIEMLMRRVQKYGGQFISVWHDRSFSRESEARPWAELYRSHLELAKELKESK